MDSLIPRTMDKRFHFFSAIGWSILLMGIFLAVTFENQSIAIISIVIGSVSLFTAVILGVDGEDSP